jgi:hypothetical protein
MTGQRNDDIGVDEAADAGRVGHEHRSVEHDSSSHTPLDIDATSMG